MESTDILKYLEGRSSEAEKRKLVKWLDASPDHVKEFEEIRFVFEMTKDIRFGVQGILSRAER